ncbi:MAG TPA: glycoside hydrolase family 43 protein [Cellulomonas sp.]
MTIANPVLPGFNPDPSMVRVGDEYYIAVSTFEWFPGVRVHASKDLVHWNLVANVLDTTTLLDMTGDPDSGGIWAPDLSYADGKFWLVYTDVKVIDGAFKDMTNYLTTATDVRGPWSDPVRLNGVGFDASLFHDDDGRKYLVQQTWDHREYHHQFDGITLTELDPFTLTPDRKTARTIYRGTPVQLVEGPHLYKIDGRYYLFVAEGGTVYGHQETVARSTSLDADSFETMPGNPLLTNRETPDFPLQKQGHGALVETPGGEWYYASLMARPWRRDGDTDEVRGWCTLGRETSIQKVEWDADGWPRIVGGPDGLVEVPAPRDAIETPAPVDHSEHDDFDAPRLGLEWNTLRVPFGTEMGSVGGGRLELVGRGSLANRHELSLVARRWQAFDFDAETAVKFDPTTYQAMAGLTNYYNTRHWSWIHVTWDEVKGRVVEVAEMDRGAYRSFLRDTVPVPDGVEWVHLRTTVRTRTYTYEYSFDGVRWLPTGVELDARILSDDYVNQTSGGFFTGAFVGLAAVDYSGYGEVATFDHFDYRELGAR